ncbi:DUF1707 SHOCT-like domain-containing protein [Actinomadura flavalba]|uniref:DUF1707 SHOCT-like domain-containing protein n=1 Tax=Actinomadura flavalba TaxID=1120938 RepID=UPI000363CDB1|nr:DUF1707 domain-containing protein [Actinomadura flavalba]
MTTRTDDLRIGDAERDAVATALHDHYVQGRLDRAERDDRLDAVLAAKTGGDLRAVVRDLPGANGLAAPVPAAFRGPGRPPWAGRPPGPFPPHRRRGGPLGPLLLVVLVAVLFTAGPGAAFAAALHVLLIAWIVRAAVHTRRRRPPLTPGS